MTDDKALALKLLPVSRETEAVLEEFVALLVRWQSVKNLIGPGTLNQIWSRHIVDSLQLATLAPAARRWLDLGSGGGLPGLVIAATLVDQPGAMVHLMESNARKCAFLREAARALRLPATVHEGRIERLAEGFAGQVDVVSARALAPLATLVGWTHKLLTSGAIALFPKGRDVELELTEATKYWRLQASIHQSLTDPEGRIVQLTRAEPL